MESLAIAEELQELQERNAGRLAARGITSYQEAVHYFDFEDRSGLGDRRIPGRLRGLGPHRPGLLLLPRRSARSSEGRGRESGMALAPEAT